MNIRKNIDYSEMFESLDKLIAQELPQMVMYCEIRKAVSRSTEKGAAVAAEYLSQQNPDVQGFSPRNLCRMRFFYHIYEDHPSVLVAAMQVGWTPNVVIMEADLSMGLREWYLKATSQFGWSKLEFIEKIATDAHEMIILAIYEDVCDIVGQGSVIRQSQVGSFHREVNKICHQIQSARFWMESKNTGKRRWQIMTYPIFTEKRIIVMRC